MTQGEGEGGYNFVPKICMILSHIITGLVLCVDYSFYIVQASHLCIECQDMVIIVQILRIECINRKVIQLILRIGQYVAKEFIGLIYFLIGGSVKKQKKYAIWGFDVSLFMVGLSCYKFCLIQSMIVKKIKNSSSLQFDTASAHFPCNH